MKYETRVKKEDKDKVLFHFLIIINQDLLFNTFKLCVGVYVSACEYVHLSAGTHSGGLKVVLGNQIQVLWKSSKYSQLLNHFSASGIIFCQAFAKRLKFKAMVL